MICTDDCTCSLCRELRGYKLKVKPTKATNEQRPYADSGSHQQQQQSQSKYCKNSKLTRNDNFILRRRTSNDYPRSPDGRQTSLSVLPTAGDDPYDADPGYAQPTAQHHQGHRDARYGQLPSNRMKKAQSYNEIPSVGNGAGRTRYHPGALSSKMIKSTNNLTEEDDYYSYLPPSPPPPVTGAGPSIKNKIEKQKDHKVIIYFGDSIAHRKSDKTRPAPPPPTGTPPPPKVSELNVFHAQRLCEETAEMLQQREGGSSSAGSSHCGGVPSRPTVREALEKKSEPSNGKPGKEFMMQLKSVLEEKNRGGGGSTASVSESQPSSSGITVPMGTVNPSSTAKESGQEEPRRLPSLEPKPKRTHTQVVEIRRVDKTVATDGATDTSLPSFVESVINGVINIKIEESFKVASDIVQAVFEDPGPDGVTEYGYDDDDVGDPFDWSFVQNWRARPSGTAVTNGQVSSPPNTSSNQSSIGLANNPTHNGSSAVSGGGSGANYPASPNGLSPGNHYIASSNPVASPGARIQSPAIATPAPRISKEIALRPANGNGGDSHHAVPTSYQVASSTTVNGSAGSAQSATHLASPVSKGAPLGITRTHHHTGTHDFRGLQRVNECHSSSDENRSSGHASMSDTGHGSSSPGGGNRTGGPLGPLPEDRLAAGVTNRSARSRASSNHSRSRHRATPAKIPWGGGGLEDIKMAIQQLTMRSHTSTSTYSSLSAGSESSEPVRRLGRYSSLETVNTNVTSADEFVWVDSHNRLVELQHPPWSQHCVLRVIRTGRCREYAERVSVEAVPRLGYLLQRALVRVAREVQRLSGSLGLCSKHEVAGAFKIVLSPALSDSCIKACLRAAAMFAVPGDSALKQSKSARAGLQLPVGRFHRWMADARLGRFVHEYAAVYLCAGLENLLEEIFLQCLPTDPGAALTATGLEHAIAGSGDLWGLLQPYAHLNAGRVASGALTMPRWASQSSINSGAVGSNALEPCLLTTCVGSLNELKDLVGRAQQRSQHIPISQTAFRVLFYFMRCSQLEHNDVGAATNGAVNNIQELCYERAYVVLPPLVEWLRVSSAHAEYRHALLIDKDDIMQAARLLLPGVDCPPRLIASEEELPSKRTGLTGTQSISSSNHSGQTQPLHGSLTSNSSTSTTASIVSTLNLRILPFCVIKPLLLSALQEDSSECGRRATYALAFRLMLTGRPELLIQALSLVPPTTRYDTLNHQGMTALMIAAARNDETALQTLLDAGADPNVEVPASGHPNCPAIHPETQHWTAVTFAACKGNYQALRILLDRGAHVEGGARLSEDKCTLTPLQVASGSGIVEVVALLLAHGAHAFLSTQQKDLLCFSGTAQRGCYSAISVSAAHGQRVTLRKLLSHPLAPGSREVLSLEEMLAEGDGGNTRTQLDRQPEAPPTLNKTQIKSLQEAMYHSAENNHLDITIELRALGVPWTLHCWMHALAAAHELRLDAVIDQLLQDFLQVCPDDYSQQFVTECLPLLFNIFRYSKVRTLSCAIERSAAQVTKRYISLQKEGTTLLLADIFSTCFGWEPIKPIKEPVLQPSNGSRIDPKFVNNPELSDVTFRVENRIFYGHKIVLVTASPRLQSMLSSKLNEGTGTPTVQINDIRYHIFELVMQFLYSGGCSALDVAAGDVLELMAAASFFQLEGLLRYTEARCAEMIDIDNVVAMYIHAKVYNAQKLMEYCQGFLLQNMVALLTYDDSVKRLLFAKKIPNHDVLTGLLTTLQARIKARRNSSSASSGGGGNNALANGPTITPSAAPVNRSSANGKQTK
uniref:BTB domain-containing protein n=1 Tax=Anopheles culicifacies TaxID=139723 RepID=A0A182LZN9_9DIPT